MMLRLNGSVSDVDLIYTEGNLNHCCWLLMLQSQVCAHIAVCTKIKITHSFLHGNLLSVFVEYDSFVSVLVYAT